MFIYVLYTKVVVIENIAAAYFATYRDKKYLNENKNLLSYNKPNSKIRIRIGRSADTTTILNP